MSLFPIKVETIYRCPECKSTDSFEVEVQVTGVYTIDKDGDVMDEHMDNEGEWFDTDNMKCEACNHEAPAGHFRRETIIMSGLPMVIER